MRVSITAGEVARLRQAAEDNDGLQHSVDTLKAELKRLERDFALVARALCKTADFDLWLMDQDRSSAMIPGKPRAGYASGIQVEGMTDHDLAVAYAEARAKEVGQ